MTPREGDVCALCGYPTEPESRLCQQCDEWQPIAKAAEAAINFNEQRTARLIAEKRTSLPPAVLLPTGTA